MSEPVVIVAFGASTAVGRDAWSSAAAVRAGISGFGQHPYMIDSVGEPMRLAAAPWLDIALTGADRLDALLFPAIEQALEPFASSLSGAPSIALALGLPSARPGLPEDIERQIMSRIRQRFARRLAAAASFAGGHAAGLIALQAAFSKLAAGALDGCVMAGVDSYIDPLTLEWLEQCDQLHGAGAQNNAWGFIPGEAAGAILLMRESMARAHQLQPLARVLGVGVAMEPKRIKTDTVCIGEGMTKAFFDALSPLPPAVRVSDIYCDLNGEPYRADEYAFTCLRAKDHFESASDFVAPADCWGDVAAAGGALHLMLAGVAAHKGYARGSIAFACASAESGERAAALVATTQPAARKG